MSEHRINIGFGVNEDDLYFSMKAESNISRLLKDLYIAYKKGEQSISAAADAEPANDPAIINALLRIFIGEDVDGYGGEKAFLRYVDKPAMNRRVSMLMAAHPVEAAAVLAAAKAKYPTVGAAML